jgi:hypothetical protein
MINAAASGTRGRDVRDCISPELVARMVELVRHSAVSASGHTQEEAKQIVEAIAQANETEEARAERLLCEIWYAPKRFDAVVKFAAEQVERGRELASSTHRGQAGEGE